MTDEQPARDNAWLDNLVQLLDKQDNTPAGVALLEQLTRIIADWQTSRSGVDTAFSKLLSSLLETLASNGNRTEMAELSARMIKAGIFKPLSNHPGVMPRQSPTPQNSAPSLTNEENPVSTQEDLQQDMSETGPEASTMAAGQSTIDNKPDTAESSGEEKVYPEVERRVNSAYRLHLDRKHGEIEKLQEVLAQKAIEAIAQNKEFGALLEIERSALKQASSISEIEELKQILIGGTDELITGQQALAEKLHSSFDYLQLIKSDSERLHEELNKVRLLSLTDEYTGLPNRRAFTRRLEDEIARAQRYGTPLALVLIDLDRFKDINDRHGHQAGDEILKWYSQNALPIFRHYDLVARYGGEEFAVLFPNTTQEGALRALNKLRGRVENASCEIHGVTIIVPTFSAGLTIYREGETSSDLINRADKALYRAKHLGRNRVEVSLLDLEKKNDIS